MKVQQLAAISNWMNSHRHRQPMEHHTYTVVLTLWLMAIIGLPVSIALNPTLLLVCVAGVILPDAYFSLRARLHQRQTLRCDWLPAAARSPQD
jgi:hypothetical protein